MDQQIEGVPAFIHINRNDFSYRKHIKQQEEDVAICECKYDANDPDSACRETCLNVLTSTECMPGYCHCGLFCKNQRFQKCEYAKTKLFRTEGRGWGLLADENIKAGQFVIEYCGEVISWKEARARSQVYGSQGLKDAFIISLNGSECIDATKKGSLGRFINHSCQPNCETRKWTVLGEVRVGIFAKQDIPIGTELAYDYNFEWYGGPKVRCLCGAISCSGFLGAKSRGFQEDTYLWEDGDDRYTVEKIPLYDSAEDEPSSKLPRVMDFSRPEFISHGKVEYTATDDASVEYDTSIRYEHQLESTELVIEAVDSVPMDLAINEIKTEVGEETKLLTNDTEPALSQKNPMIPHIQTNSANQSNHIGPGHVGKKRSKHYPNGRSKPIAEKQVDAKFVAQFLGSEEARQEVFKYEVHLLYRGTLRVLLVLLHDFPEFLCGYHFTFCDVIPPSCIQMRNIILSAFPRNMRLPDPSTPNLKIDLLAEIGQTPLILSDVDAALKVKQMKTDVDEYLKLGQQGSSFLSGLKQRLLLLPIDAARAGTHYNIPLINSLVLYVGMQAMQQMKARTQPHGQPVPSSPLAGFLVSGALDIFQTLLAELDTEGRYLFLNAVANQLRYPNTHTHYFSFILLYLFAESNQEIIPEQITRVLLERLIVSRPHPWGLLITFIELIKNPRYNFWNRSFIRCAPEIEKLFESVSRSCGGANPLDEGTVSGGFSENMH